MCAYVGGSKVVDLWGGWADAARTQEWRRDTIVCTMSATKGMTATCAHQLIDRGLLDVDEPVATYWPEFAQAGKDKITVRMVLSHQAGRPWPTVPVPDDKRFDWETMTAALARGTPRWEPGSRSEYHGGTFGYLVGEIVRRIDGRSLDTYFKEEIAERLGADFLMGVGPDDDHRCAEIVGPDDMVGGSNTRAFRRAADGSATGHGTADGLARVYGARRASRRDRRRSSAACRDHRGGNTRAATGACRRDKWSVQSGLPAAGDDLSVGGATSVRTLGFGRVLGAVRPGTPARVRIRDEPTGQPRRGSSAVRHVSIARRVACRPLRVPADTSRFTRPSPGGDRSGGRGRLGVPLAQRVPSGARVNYRRGRSEASDARARARTRHNAARSRRQRPLVRGEAAPTRARDPDRRTQSGCVANLCGPS